MELYIQAAEMDSTVSSGHLCCHKKKLGDSLPDLLQDVSWLTFKAPASVPEVRISVVSDTKRKEKYLYPGWRHRQTYLGHVFSQSDGVWAPAALLWALHTVDKHQTAAPMRERVCVWDMLWLAGQKTCLNYKKRWSWDRSEDPGGDAEKRNKDKNCCLVLRHIKQTQWTVKNNSPDKCGVNNRFRLNASTEQQRNLDLQLSDQKGTEFNVNLCRNSPRLTGQETSYCEPLEGDYWIHFLLIFKLQCS